VRSCTAVFLSLRGKGLEFKALLCLDIAADSQDSGYFGKAETQNQLLNTKKEKGIKLYTVWIERRETQIDKGNTTRQIARSNYREKECFSDTSKKPQEQSFVSSYHRTANTSATLLLIKTISAAKLCIL